MIFQEFNGTGSRDPVLRRQCAQGRHWPAIDIKQSGTRNEHLFFQERRCMKRCMSGGNWTLWTK